MPAICSTPSNLAIIHSSIFVAPALLRWILVWHWSMTSSAEACLLCSHVVFTPLELAAWLLPITAKRESKYCTICLSNWGSEGILQDSIISSMPLAKRTNQASPTLWQVKFHCNQLIRGIRRAQFHQRANQRAGLHFRPSAGVYGQILRSSRVRLRCPPHSSSRVESNAVLYACITVGT